MKSKIYLLSFIILLAGLALGLDFFTNSGVYFGLDVIFFPVYELSPFFSKSLYFHFQDIISLFSYEFFSRFLLVSTLLIGSILGIYIVKLVSKIFNINNIKHIFALQILSIFFIITNPFAYDRFILQTGIILGVYFVGLAFVFLLFYLLESRNRDLYLSSLFTGLSLAIFPHAIVFIVLIFIFTLVFFIKNFSFKSIFISIIIFLLLNTNLLFQFVLPENASTNLNSISAIVSTFDNKNLEAFVSNSLDPLSIEFTNLLLYGMWSEKYNQVKLPGDTFTYWYIAGFLVFIIVIYGGIELYQKQKRLTLFLISVSIFAYIIGLSISSNIVKPFLLLLYNYIPYFDGLREPQKLIGLVMIIYSVFFIIGIYSLFLKYETTKKRYIYRKIFLSYYAIVIYAFITIFLWSPNVLFGYAGQIKISEYPEETFVARDFLLERKAENVLLFPWHSYFGCLWNDRVNMSNPFPAILRPIKTLGPENIEFANIIYTNSKDNKQLLIDDFKKTKDINILKKLGIDYIYFTDNCAGYTEYDYLKTQTDNYFLAFTSDNIKIYKIK